MAGLTHDEAVRVARTRLEESIASKQAMLDTDCVEQAAVVAGRLVMAIRAGGKAVFFGNGGSSMDAGHLAAELLGRFYIDRPALPAISLPDNTATMTAIGNDYSYDEVFARQLLGIARAGDVVVGLSTSGNSENVVRALQTGRQLGAFTVAMTGASGGRAEGVAELCIKVPSNDTPRIQEACLHLGHSICELVEESLFGKGSHPL